MDQWKAVNRILCYLHGTKHYMLTYKKYDNLEVVGKWLCRHLAGCVDSRRLTSRYVFAVARGVIS
jgi:hypothetical protein